MTHDPIAIKSTDTTLERAILGIGALGGIGWNTSLLTSVKLQEKSKELIADMELDYPANVYLWASMALLAYLISDVKLVSKFEDVPVPSEASKLREDQSLAQHTRALVSHSSEIWQRAGNLKFSHRLLLLPVLIFLNFCSLFSRVFCRQQLSRRYWNYAYETIAAQLADARYIRDVALSLRPLILTWLCIWPFSAIIMMIYHNTRKFLGIFHRHTASDTIANPDCVVLQQNLDMEKAEDSVTFFHSPSFTVVALSMYLLGIPGMICYWLYMHTGVDAVFLHASQNKAFQYVIVFIQFYLASLSSCLMALFFKAYFTFALNFTSGEYTIEIHPDLIKTMPIEGWFRDFMFLRSEHSPCQIYWKDLTTVSFEQATLSTPLSLPAPLRFMNKIMAVQDSMTRGLRSDVVTIASPNRKISINLRDLSKAEKGEIFMSLRKYAPSIFIDAATQQALVGSTVMNEPRYTQIWFDVFQQGCTTGDAKQLTVGSKVGQDKFEMLEKLASGGQAVTYICADGDGNKVVLKEFQLALGESIDVLMESARAFENESTILGQLNHPQIVKLHEMFHENNKCYLVLAYVEGMTLRQLVAAKGACDQHFVANLGVQMCHLLAYLHSQNPPIVHRDFTPDNLMLRPDGRLTLIDFSVAEARLDKGVSNCAGKHAYTPPEQFRGEATGQSDIYAAGCTLAFLVTGKDPKPLTTSIIEQTGVSTGLADAIRTATELSLDKRYDSAQWLESALLALGGSEARADNLETGVDSVGERSTDDANNGSDATVQSLTSPPAALAIAEEGRNETEGDDSSIVTYASAQHSEPQTVKLSTNDELVPVAAKRVE